MIKKFKKPFLCYVIKLIKNKGIFWGKNPFNIRIFNSDYFECRRLKILDI